MDAHSLLDARATEPTFDDACARIRARNPEIAAFVTTRLDRAAREADSRRADVARSPLHGVPYALKDTWEVRGEVTTAGSHRYADRVSPVDSPVHEAFRDAGAILLGKTNLSDLMLVPESSSYVGGVCRNPHDPTRTAGGSSGGAAAAVADGMVAFDWGSDVGGSIRMPAAYCGVLGMRLSSETWSMRGDFPRLPESLRWMNGQGPITRTAARMRDVLRAAAPLRTGAARAFRCERILVLGPERGVEGEWPAFEAEAAAAFARAAPDVPIVRRRDVGSLVPGQVEGRDVAIAMWASHFEDLLESDELTLVEGLHAVASALLVRGRGGDKRFHPHTAAVLALITLGRVTLFRHRGRAQRAAQAYRDRFGELWDKGLLVVLPTSTWPAPRHGHSFRNRHVQVYAMGGNVADATGLSIPFGRFSGGMPRGLQILGPPGSEDVVLDLGARVLKLAGFKPAPS